MLEKFTVIGPTFVTASAIGELVFGMFSFPKDRLRGEKLRATPNPLKFTVVGLLGSESNTLKLPF
jgi:hypothetical protein